MAALPESEAFALEPPSLIPATSAHAPFIAWWISNAQEALWTAPQTLPPIGAASVTSWIAAAVRPLALVERAMNRDGGNIERLAGYGEVNPFDTNPEHFWLGHIVVDPARRGRGYGRRIAEGLRRIAFGELNAKKLTLVVFPDNEPARRAYAAAGFEFEGYETHLLKPYDRREVLVRMVARA